MFIKSLEFNVDFFSDVRVVFTSSVPGGLETDSGSRLDGSTGDGLSFLAHKVVLALSSSVFLAMLKKAEEEQKEAIVGKESFVGNDCSANAKGREIMEVLVEEEELDGAEVLLRFIYSGDLDADLQLSTAPALWDQPPIQDLHAKCLEFLLETFGQAPAIIRDTALGEDFLRLCFPALLALVSSDHLHVDSENDVVVLISMWLDHNGPCSSTEQLVLLSKAIRLLHTTRCYLAHLKSVAPWFQAEATVLDGVLAVQGAANAGYVLDCSLLEPDIPPAWLGPARGYLPEAAIPFAIPWQNLSRLLRRATDAPDGVIKAYAMSPAVYCSGYEFSFGISVAKVQGAKTKGVLPLFQIFFSAAANLPDHMRHKRDWYMHCQLDFSDKSKWPGELGEKALLLPIDSILATYLFDVTPRQDLSCLSPYMDADHIMHLEFSLQVLQLGTSCKHVPLRGCLLRTYLSS
eukprot:gene14554-20595_t